MKSIALVALVAAAAFAVAHAQSGLYPNFPFCNCISNPAAYSLDPAVKAMGDNKYCFTLRVTPPPGCSSYCCTKADLRKMEFNVNSGCDVSGAVVKATINGVPTKVGPDFDSAKQGPPGATILRLTQLGLNMTSDGAEICITLKPNNAGVGCTTLSQLCVPPAGMPAGVCSVAMFDTKLDCCPIGDIGVPSPPPPTPPSPPPPSPPPPCTVCTYAVLTPVKPVFPISISKEQCDAFAAEVVKNVVAQAEAVGAMMVDTPPVISCSADVIKVCGTFVSDAEGAKLQTWLEDANKYWLSIITGPTCPAYFYGYDIAVITSGDGVPPNVPAGCLYAEDRIACTPSKPDFPKCECDTRPRATPFGALPVIVSAGGRKNTTTFYCFLIETVAPLDPNSACGKTTNLLKAEIFADENQRRKIVAMGVKPAGTDTMKFLSPTWGAKGEYTLKATPLNWSLDQAKGALICMELDSKTDIKSFCMTGSETCWINFFDNAKKCCPLYPATLI